MKAKKLYFMNCHLAGRQYHDADEVWDDLKVGTILQLERDSENRHDPYAVAVNYYKQDEEEPYTIGYIPRGENETIANILEMGWTDLFECRISKIDEEAHPEHQVYMTIKIKKNRNNERR
ncbi:MAG: HIRAN domain-containing protein [Bacteroidaceae bacterium]|nr:HIRAN domain-containing protein [Bacteroidaceae bacterium]